MSNPVPGAVASRIAPTGEVVALLPLMFGRLRLTVGRGLETYERGW